VNFPHEGTSPRVTIDVLYHNDAGLWDAEDVVPPVRPLMVAIAFHRRVGGTNPGCRCVTDHRRKLVEHASNTGIGKAGVTQAYAECFDGICDRAAVERPQILQQHWR